MAAALLRRYLGRSIYVASAGLTHGEPDAFAVQVMAEMGLEMGAHRPHTFDQLGDSSFDLVVALSPDAQHHAVELARTGAVEIEYWPTFDPTGVEGSCERRLAAYRGMRDAPDARVRTRFRVPEARTRPIARSAA